MSERVNHSDPPRTPKTLLNPNLHICISCSQLFMKIQLYVTCQTDINGWPQIVKYSLQMRRNRGQILKERRNVRFLGNGKKTKKKEK